MTCHKPLLVALQSRGLRRTPQRTAILEQMCHNHGHLTAEQVFRLARRRLPDLNIATVYRTLETLRQAGVISGSITPAGIAEFELSRPEIRHHHLRCRTCGGEWLLPAEPIEHLRSWLGRRHAFTPDLDHLVITGLCAACRRAAGPPSRR